MYLLRHELCVCVLLQPDELEYSLKRLVDGLAHTREVARPGFSLALGQVCMVSWCHYISHQLRDIWISFELI